MKCKNHNLSLGDRKTLMAVRGAGAFKHPGALMLEGQGILANAEFWQLLNKPLECTYVGPAFWIGNPCYTLLGLHINYWTTLLFLLLQKRCKPCQFTYKYIVISNPINLFFHILMTHTLHFYNTVIDCLASFKHLLNI